MVDITLTVVMRQVIAWELQPFFLSCFFFSFLFFCLFRSAQLLSKQTKGTAQRLFNSLQVLNKLAWLNKDTSGTSINKRHHLFTFYCKYELEGYQPRKVFNFSRDPNKLLARLATERSLLWLKLYVAWAKTPFYLPCQWGCTFAGVTDFARSAWLHANDRERRRRWSETPRTEHRTKLAALTGRRGFRPYIRMKDPKD